MPKSFTITMNSSQARLRLLNLSYIPFCQALQQAPQQVLCQRGAGAGYDEPFTTTTVRSVSSPCSLHRLRRPVTNKLAQFHRLLPMNFSLYFSREPPDNIRLQYRLITNVSLCLAFLAFLLIYFIHSMRKPPPFDSSTRQDTPLTSITACRVRSLTNCPDDGWWIE